jgi:ABC-type sugar transport system ATPase subunit
MRAIERLGDRMDVVVAVGGTRLVARIENDERLQEGGPAGVRIELGAAHLFAPGEDGARLPDAGDAR